MRTLEYRRQAERDLDGIKDYIARDNPRRALSFIRELRRVCERLADTIRSWVALVRSFGRTCAPSRTATT